MIVVDASLAVGACTGEAEVATLVDQELVGPALLWSESRSVLHQLLWRGAIPARVAEAIRQRLEALPVRRVDHEQLGREAWQVADELGWAKTYDAEYVALARLLGCRLVTLDLRLRRGAARLGLVVTPTEL